MESDPSETPSAAPTRSDDPSLLAAVLDALPELVFVIDRDGRYVDVLGGRDDQRYHDGRALIGQRMHDVMPHELADGFLARIHEALDTGKVITVEYALNARDVDGVESRPGMPDGLWFEGRVARLPSTEGRADRAVWMAFNVTQARVAIEQLQRQKQELEDLAASKERILSIVSHDLRGPLTSIQGFLDLLGERWDELDPEQAQDFVRRGRDRAVQMQQMLVDLLDASRHDHAERVAQPRDVSVPDLLHDVVSGLGGDASGVVVRHAEGRVHADPGHVSRIVTNLIDNARKYGAPPVEVSAEHTGDQIRIQVRDHGDGIPDEFVPKLFSPFAQARPATDVEGGIGLGLSIVHELARQNGGSATYVPSPDGACFLVTLPAGPADR